MNDHDTQPLAQPLLPPKENEIFPGVLLMENPSGYLYSPREDGNMRLFLVVEKVEMDADVQVAVLEDDQVVRIWHIERLIEQTLLVSLPKEPE